MAILEEFRNELLRVQEVRHGNDGTGDAQRAQLRSELMDSIGLLLEQHEETLLRQAEVEFREKALAAVKQESELLRRQVYERVLSANSAMQREIATILSDAREKKFQRVGEEVSAILEGTDARLLGALSISLPETALTLPVQCQENNEASEPAIEPVLEERGTEAGAESEELYQHEVSVAIVPPFRLPTLMEFYRCLWQMHNLSAVQTSGSVDKGITLELRLTEPKALQQVLKSIPYVESARGSSTQASGNGRRTINVTLKPPAETVIDHVQP